jgi:hypothetical protein
MAWLDDEIASSGATSVTRHAPRMPSLALRDEVGALHGFALPVVTSKTSGRRFVFCVIPCTA